jgi:signal transduction histidine kinase
MKKIRFYTIISFAFLLDLLIGYIDWKSNDQIPFTILYVLPVFLIAYQKKATKIILVANSFLPALIWIITYFQLDSYPIILLNGILRFVIFLVLSFIIQLLIKQKEMLHEKNIELIQLNEEKNVILGTAAHDIRNGIGAIHSFSELLVENQDLKSNFKQESKFIDIIHQSSGNLIILLNNILDISKIESGKIIINTASADYICFVEERLAFFQLITQKKQIEIVKDFKINSLKFEFDHIYLQEVFDNLLSNAIKYSYPKSQIKITIYQKYSSAITEVSDSGVGIPAPEIGKLFKVFSKVSSKPTSNETSSGLGLAIAKKIIDLHKGTIGVKSTFGQGSTFYFSLPIN